MSPIKRRIILVIFGALFVISSVVIIVYAQGYRWDKEHGRLVQTGIIFVNGRPKDSTIMINGERVGNSLPHRQTHLIPGTYTIRVEKDGYFAWEKVLSVEARKTNFATEITLFKNEEPSAISDLSDATDLVLHDETLYAVKSHTVSASIVKLVGDKLEHVWTAITPGESLKSAKLTMHPTGDFGTLQLETGMRQRTGIFFPQKPNDSYIMPVYSTRRAQRVFFDDSHTSVLYVQSGDSIFRYDIENKTYRLLTSGIYLGLQNDLMLYFGEGEQGIGIYTEHILTGEKTLLTTPQSGFTPIFLADHNQTSWMWDSINQNVWSLDIGQKKLRALPISSEQLPDVLYSSTLSKLAIWTPHEVWLADGETENLIKRSSVGIKKIAFVGNRPYFLLWTNQDLSIVELDDRNKRNTATLRIPHTAKHFAVDKEGKRLFIVGGKENQKLYDLFLTID